MKKILKAITTFILFISYFAANTSSQLGTFQIDAPDSLKKGNNR